MSIVTRLPFRAILTALLLALWAWGAADTRAQEADAPPPPAAAAQGAAAEGPADGGQALRRQPPPRVGVRVRGGNHETYGRMVFDWDAPVRYRVERVGDQLRLSFERPATFDLSPMMPALQNYVGQGAPGPHGYRISFPLKGSFEIEHWTTGRKVVIDLKGSPPRRVPVPPDPPPAGAAEASDGRPRAQAVPGAQSAGSEPAGPQSAGPQSVGNQSAGHQSAGAEPATDAPAAAAPAETAGRAGTPADPAAPKIRVRFGQHEGHGRMVFDWPRPVPYEIRHAPGAPIARVRFDTPARFDLSRYDHSPPRQILGVRAQPTAAEASAVAFAVAPAAELKAFRVGPKLVLDVHGAAPTDAAEAAAQAALAAAAAPRSGASSQADASAAGTGGAARDGRAGTGAPAETDAPAAAAAGAAPSAPAHAPPRPPQRPAAIGAPTPLTADAAAQGAGGQAAADATRPPDDADVAGTGAPPAVQPPALQPPPLRPLPGQAAVAAALSPGMAAPQPGPVEERVLPDPRAREAEPDTTAMPAGALPNLKPLTPAALADADPVLDTARRYSPEAIARGSVPRPGETPPQAEAAELALPWAGRHAAAFEHADTVWALVDGAAPDDFAAGLAATVPDATGQGVDLRDGRTLIRIEGAAHLRARAELAGGTWRLALQHAPVPPIAPLELEIAEDGRSARVPTAVAGSPLTLQDPGSGGRLIVVPVARPGQGVALARSFPEFRLLASETGIVVQPLADYVDVTVEDAGVTIRGRSRPLMLSGAAPGSPPAGAADGAPAPDRPARAERLLDLAEWRRPGQNFVDAKQSLQDALGAAAGADRPLARLDLARFYFAHGLAAETLGALKLYQKNAPRRAEDPQVLLMQGAAHLLNGDWREAARMLTHPVLDGVPEALPWQGAYAALSGAPGAAVDAFDTAQPLLADYPAAVRKQLHLWSAAARLDDAGDLVGAEAELDEVRALEPTAGERAELTFLEGRRELLEGDAEAAEAAWQRAAASSHPPARARARFVLAERALAAGTADTADTVDELERLRFSWRGDEFEALLLQRLADLYVSDAQYKRALDSLRQIVANLPDAPQAKRAAARMRVLFAELFLDGDADRMPPLKALALYEAYRELTPAGPRGDRIIDRLVERLVGVDLLNRAASLLEGQVRHRLSGLDAARTGARLARIRLMDQAPKRALEALDLSAEPDLPAGIERQRRHLRARALADSGAPDKALTLLAGDESDGALEISARVHANRGDWAAAATTLARLLPNPPADGTALPETAADRVMRTAVALTLAGRKRDLRELSERYAGAMADSAHADAFELLDPSTGGGPVTVAKQLAEVQQAQSFLDSFRDGAVQDAAAQ